MLRLRRPGSADKPLCLIARAPRHSEGLTEILTRSLYALTRCRSTTISLNVTCRSRIVRQMSRRENGDLMQKQPLSLTETAHLFFAFGHSLVFGGSLARVPAESASLVPWRGTKPGYFATVSGRLHLHHFTEYAPVFYEALTALLPSIPRIALARRLPPRESPLLVCLADRGDLAERSSRFAGAAVVPKRQEDDERKGL